MMTAWSALGQYREEVKKSSTVGCKEAAQREKRGEKRSVDGRSYITSQVLAADVKLWHAMAATPHPTLQLVEPNSCDRPRLEPL